MQRRTVRFAAGLSLRRKNEEQDSGTVHPNE
jgi:hypothetical protein